LQPWTTLPPTQTVGRISSQLAKILQGKDKPTFDNNQDTGDVCIVINAAHANFTGNKWDDKMYRWHTGAAGAAHAQAWAAGRPLAGGGRDEGRRRTGCIAPCPPPSAGMPGGARTISARRLWEKDPAEIIRKAVQGMLPKNRLLVQRMLKLRVFPLEQHAFEQFPLEPWTMPPRTLRNKKLDWALPPGFLPMNDAAYQRRLRASRLRSAQGLPTADFDDLLQPEERAMVEEIRKKSL
jgi:large subunit ribosomal protein L13